MDRVDPGEDRRRLSLTPDLVAGDRGSTVVLRGQPAQLHMLGTDLVGHQVPWLGWNVKHINIAGRLKCARLANKLDRVAACVTGTVRLWNAEDRVSLCVN